MVPGLVDPAMFDLDSEQLMPGDLDRYCVKVLRHFFKAACAQAEELILLNYNQLPQIVWNDLLDLFSISPTPTELEAMEDRSGLHSKNAAKFTGDPQPAAQSAGIELCATLYPYYKKLEQLRLNRMNQGL